MPRKPNICFKRSRCPWLQLADQRWMRFFERVYFSSLPPFFFSPALPSLSLPTTLPSSLPYFSLCASPSASPPSRRCSIFKRACSAQVILAAAGEGSDKSLMVEKRVCGTSGTQRRCQLICRGKGGWRKVETVDGEAWARACWWGRRRWRGEN